MSTHRKIKSVAKVQVPSSKGLDKAILDTMGLISALVGSTLGPGGKVVGIERQEFGVADLVTKDGVTVFRNMGFLDPVAHSIMGLARDAAVRTATEAGDGTTTATVLAEAFVRFCHEFCKNNPKVSPQRVVRTMEKIFRSNIEPHIKSLAIRPDTNLLKSVATCSTNGDSELTGAITKCFELTGDEGNVTITEHSGPSGYKVEALKGYPLSIGYEECVGKYFSVFVNDATNNRVYLEKPIFILYNGTIRETANIYPLLEKIGKRWGGVSKANGPHNIVVVANGFGDSFLEDMAASWPDPTSLNIYLMRVPQNAMQSGQIDILTDLAAVTGSAVLDPISKPAQQAELEDVGPALEYFESNRYRTNVVGVADEGLVLARVEELEAQLPLVESEVERRILSERKGKLSGGIARLMISAPTSGELREKRDRAEDATCAWRGAVKHGALPGGGWTLLQVIDLLTNLDADDFSKLVIAEVMKKALMEPVRRLLSNCGYNAEEIDDRVAEMQALLKEPQPVIFDALEGVFKVAKDSGVVDSLPAVLEAVRNSLSIASQLGTLGGMIVFPRDLQLERDEAAATYDYYRATGMMKSGED